MVRLGIVTIIAALATAASAINDIRNLPDCAYICNNLVTERNFNCSSFKYQAYAECICKNKNIASSMALCARDNCPSEAEKSYSYVHKYCAFKNVELVFDWNYEEALAYGDAHVNKSADLNVTTQQLQTSPIEFPAASYIALIPTFKEYYGNFRFSEIYGLVFCYILLLIVLSSDNWRSFI